MQGEAELDRLEKPIKKYLRNNPSDGDLQKALAAVAKLRDEYELLPRDEAQKLKEETQKLKEAPLQYAIYLGPGPTYQRDVLVGLGHSLFEARLADGLDLHQLSLGQQVLLNHEQNVVGIRDEYVRGETAEVINILKPQNSGEIIALLENEGSPLHALVKWKEGEEAEVRCSENLSATQLARGDIVQIDPETMVAQTKVRPRLHIRAGGTEGTVVEISDKLFNEGVRLGDLVRVESALKFAFEKLPSRETRELTLEEVPDISYADIGGLDAQIETFRDAIELPYLQRAKFDRYQLSRPKGILLYGPPGCGKTMVAKAVANSLTESIRDHLTNLEQRVKLYIKLKADPNDAAALKATRTLLGMDTDSNEPAPSETLVTRLERALEIHDVDLRRPEEKLREIQGLRGREEVRSYFLNVKGPELLDKYVGETEHRIRSIFEEARRHASYYTPVVIFFDEMEAMFRARGTGRSSDIETTIVPQFLSEIDGFESSANVILIGATNRDDMIDPAILRPGRLDVKIKIDRPSKEAATDIFSFYLLPILPLQRGTQPPEQKLVGRIVFRSAYTKTNDQFDRGRLPPNFDLRLALSFSQEERTKLAEFSQNLSVAQVLLHKHEESDSLPLWVKLNLVKANTRLSDITPKLDALHRSYSSDAKLKQRLDQMVELEWLAEAMIHDAVSLLYSPSSLLKVLAKSGNHYTFPLSDFVTGAVIANIVSRTKKRAIKRELMRIDGDAEGISTEDLRAAIEEEFSESQEQLTLYKLRDEMDLGNELIQSVDLRLENDGTDPWSEEKPRAYKIN